MSYYRFDTRNLTFAELWRIAKVGFPIVALLKIFRISLPMRVAIAHPTRVVRMDEFELDVDGRRARLQRDTDAFERAGTRFRFLDKVPMLSPESSSIGAAFLSDDGWIYGVIIEAIARVGTKTTRTKQVALVTPLTDGRFLSTASTGSLTPHRSLTASS